MHDHICTLDLKLYSVLPEDKYIYSFFLFSIQSASLGHIIRKGFTLVRSLVSNLHEKHANITGAELTTFSLDSSAAETQTGTQLPTKVRKKNRPSVHVKNTEAKRSKLLPTPKPPVSDGSLATNLIEKEAKLKPTASQTNKRGGAAFQQPADLPDEKQRCWSRADAEKDRRNIRAFVLCDQLSAFKPSNRKRAVLFFFFFFKSVRFCSPV